jgi:hypothetical protein
MKYRLIFVLLISCCSQKASMNNKELISLNVFHEECTGCLEATIMNNPFQYPDSIKKYLSDTSSRDILLEGKNPYKEKGALSNLLNDSYLKKQYKLLGYFSRVDSTNNPVGRVPVFYVVKWESLKGSLK